MVTTKLPSEVTRHAGKHGVGTVRGTGVVLPNSRVAGVADEAAHNNRFPIGGPVPANKTVTGNVPQPGADLNAITLPPDPPPSALAKAGSYAETAVGLAPLVVPGAAIFGDKVLGRSGLKNALNREVGSTRLGRFVADKVVQPVANVVGAPLNTLTSGFSGRRARNNAPAAEAFTELQKHAGEVNKELVALKGNIPDSLHERLTKSVKSVTDLRSHQEMNLTHPSVFEMAEKDLLKEHKIAAKAVKTAEKNVVKAVRSGPASLAANAPEMIKLAEAKARFKPFETLAGLNKKTYDQSALGTFKGSLNKAFTTSDAAKDIKTIAKNASKEVKGMSIGHAVSTASFIGMDAMSLGHTGMQMGHDLSTVKAMYADMMGKNAKDVSTLDLFTADLPKPLKQMRNAVMREHVAAGLLNGVALVGNIIMARKPNVSMKQNLLYFMAPNLLAGKTHELLGNHEAMDAYATLTKAHKAGIKIPASDYAAYLAIATPQCQNRSGGYKEPVIVALSEQYAKEGASPSVILREAADGKLDARITAVTSAYAASHPAPAAQSSTHFTDRLKGGAAAMPGPVVGDKTQKIANDLKASALQPSGPAHA